LDINFNLLLLAPKSNGKGLIDLSFADPLQGLLEALLGEDEVSQPHLYY